MELNKKLIQKGEYTGAITHQFQMDMDLNVPDAKADMVKVLQGDGSLHITEITRMEQYVKVTGTVVYQVLYATDDEDHRVSCLEGKIPVEELIYVDGDESTRYQVKSNQLDIAVHLIHSRKVNVKTTVELMVEGMVMVEEEVSVDIEEGNNILCRNNRKKILQLNQCKKDTYRIKEEVKLPGMKDSIGSILMTKIGSHKLDTRAESDTITFRGECQFFCMYVTEEWKEDWVESTITFEGRVDCMGLTEEMYHQVHSDIQDLSVDIHMDEDGEMRIFGVEATVMMDITVYEEEELVILEDMYAMYEKCELTKKKMSIETLIVQNQSRCRLVETLGLPELKEELLQICNCKGMVQTDYVEVTPSGLSVEGILHINFLYVKGSDREPYASWQGMIPFTHIIECATEKNLSYTIDGKLEQLSVTMAGNNEVEVKASLGYSSLIKKAEILEVIESAEIRDYTKAELEEQAGIIGYIYKEGDRLWDLAKKYHTTVEGILSVNNLQEKDVKAGQKLLIFKESLSIL